MVVALSTVPSPLYGLYRARDGFSSFTVTIIYAAYATGVVSAVILAGHLSDGHGRRRTLVPAAGLSVISALIFLGWKALPGLLLARVVNGISVGIVASTATAYLVELRARYRPQLSGTQVPLTAATVNLGGLGVGALVAGLLAQWVDHPLTVPYLVFVVAMGLAVLGVVISPETREHAISRPRYRLQRVEVPRESSGEFSAAIISAFMAFSTLGLFTDLARVFLMAVLHHPTHALTGATVFCTFSAGAIVQLATVTWPSRRELGAGMAMMVLGLAVTVIAVWLSTPGLPLFLTGGAVTGAGAGAIFRGALSTVIRISRPESRAEALAGLYLACYVGVSIPVVGIGAALANGVSPPITILGFGVAVSVGIVASGVELLGKLGSKQDIVQPPTADRAAAPRSFTDEQWPPPNPGSAR